ncbi:Protocadherin-9 [Dissostichus eleginoides]|uniref:Protocadherin-9 n=1 Tax=Dissostichus eleginoides TaxID=100907 RepID=A0AAD9BGH4_DISEL|nr:Protocadherin-9 [Dissostichus eleginoides]
MPVGRGSDDVEACLRHSTPPTGTLMQAACKPTPHIPYMTYKNGEGFVLDCRFISDIRSLPDVAMTGNCTNECSELGHSDACWMPGHPSPIRKARNPPKLSTFVPYQERGSLGRLANGSARLGGEEPRSRLPPSRSAYSNSGNDASQDCPLEEMPLSVASEFPPTPPSAHTPKREIYL